MCDYCEMTFAPESVGMSESTLNRIKEQHKCPVKLYEDCLSGEFAEWTRNVGPKKQNLMMKQIEPAECECGHSIFQSWKFCPHCGAMVGSSKVGRMRVTNDIGGRSVIVMSRVVNGAEYSMRVNYNPEFMNPGLDVRIDGGDWKKVATVTHERMLLDAFVMIFCDIEEVQDAD